MHPDQRPAILPSQSLWRLVREGLITEADLDAQGRLLARERTPRAAATPHVDAGLVARYEALLWEIDASSSSRDVSPTTPRCPPSRRITDALETLEARVAQAERELVLLRRALYAANVRVPLDVYE